VNRIKVKGYAAAVLDSEVREIGSDPSAFGLEGDEALAYREASRLWDGNYLTVPASWEQRERLANLMRDLSNSYDASGNDPQWHYELRRQDQAAAKGLGRIHGLLLAQVVTDEWTEASASIMPWSSDFRLYTGDGPR